ncbi:MAG: response regulator [Lachnospiraceae bacterium]|nr:response regulator [Lachnospiraceae bacterium]
MEKRVLFISEKKTMIANALIQTLEEKAFQVVQVKANVTELSRIEEKPEIWLLYLQGVDRNLLDLLSFIRDQIKEHGYRLYAIGTPEELEEDLKGFPPSDLKGTFTRPFRMENVIDRLEMEVMNVERLSAARCIMIIDDDPLMLQAFKEMLQSNYRVYTANSGMNALQMLVNTNVDLILLDYEMPVIKGPQILEMLRSEAHTKDIPVMFLTSKNDRDSIIQVMNLNPVNYLLKSLPQSEICGKIREYFEQQG